MKENYSEAEITRIIALSYFYNVDPSKVRQLLDNYFTEHFDDALKEAQDNLELTREEMIAEGLDSERDEY